MGREEGGAQGKEYNFFFGRSRPPAPFPPQEGREQKSVDISCSLAHVHPAV